MKSVAELRIQIFADGANLGEIANLTTNPLIQGFTTNPTLMRQAGVDDYAGFAKDMLALVGDRPVSFEVFADDFDDMQRQAMEIASWGDNVFVKIPITNTKGEASAPLVERLMGEGVSVNVTAIMTIDQVRDTAAVLDNGVPAVVSVFAGRIADTGVDPVPVMAECRDILADNPAAQLLWGSPREVLNVYHAEEAGCDIITVTHGLLAKLDAIGKDLGDFSLDTVKMFYSDGLAAGYRL